MKDWLLSCRVIRNRDLWMTYLVLSAAALSFGLAIGSEFAK
jgi:hypothetical protein